jgi:hypothetical protein
MAEDQPKVLAERLIAWASVAYGCGFLVVLLHTARLGVPVLELVKPIYILIGLPLAAVGYFSRQIVSWMRTTAVASRNEVIRALWNKYISPEDKDVVIDKFLRTLSETAPWYFSALPLRPILVWRWNRVLANAQSRPDRLKAWIDILDYNARFFIAYAALIRLLRGLLVVAAAGFVLGQYVWNIYPRIPLAYGGGAPVNVRLLLDTSKLPHDIPYLTGSAPTTTGKEDQVFLTPHLELLYITSTDYLVRDPAGSVVALARDVVTGVVYRDGKAISPLPIKRIDAQPPAALQKAP